MKTIIAATDFSPASHNAVLYAADLAMSLHASLLLYHTVENTVALSEASMLYTGEYFPDESLCMLEELKDELLLYTHQQEDIKFKLRFGNINNELDQLCYEEKPFLMVMAATKKTTFERLVSGSNTLTESHYCTVPLLLIPENVSFKKINKIAVATQFCNVCDTMPLQQLTYYLRQFNVEIEIINVAKPNGGMQGINAAEAIALQTHFKEFNPTFHYIANNQVEDGIYEYVKQLSPNLLILIPKKHSWFHKSLSKQLILHPTVPVMIMPQHCKN